jgi:hypothetical protein
MKTGLKPHLFSCFVFAFLLFGLSSHAQSFYRNGRFNSTKRYTSIGVMLNATNYFGDIAPRESFLSTDIKFTRPNIGIFVSRRLTPVFSVRASFAWGRLQADDFNASTSDDNARFRYVRNLSFRNDIKELAVTGQLDLIPNRGLFYRRPRVVPYVFAGIAVFYHNPKAKLDKETAATEGLTTGYVALQPLGTEGQGIQDGKKKYSLVQIAIPYGAGVRFRLADRIDLAVEIGLRQTFTDFIDDVSGNYPTAATYAQMSPQARAFSNRSANALSAGGKERDGDLIVSLYGNDPFVVVTDPSTGQDLITAINGHSAGDQRGKPNENDQYLVTGFHLSYILFRGVRCPKF